MSSYKRKISAKNVRITEHSKALNDKLYTDEDQFDEAYVEDKKMSIQDKVLEMEQNMMAELESKKQAFIDKGYEEGQQLAIQEAEQRLQKQVEHILEQANQLYSEANAYKRKILDEAEAMKVQAFAEQKEDFLALITDSVRAIIQNDIEPDAIRMDAIYEQAMKNITYGTKRVAVRIHPVMRHWFEQEAGAEDIRLEVYYDVHLAPGDLFIETDKEFIDASVEQKLQALKDKMRGVVDDSI